MIVSLKPPVFRLGRTIDFVPYKKVKLRDFRFYNHTNYNDRMLCIVRPEGFDIPKRITTPPFSLSKYKK
jgi:hypothetical protein